MGGGSNLTYDKMGSQFISQIFPKYFKFAINDHVWQDAFFITKASGPFSGGVAGVLTS